MKNYVVPPVNVHDHSLVIYITGNKDSLPLQESSDHKSQIFASSGKEISGEEVIVSPGESSSGKHQRVHIFPTSNSLLQSDVISLRGGAMSHNQADISVGLLPAIANLLPVPRSEFSTLTRNDPLELRSNDSLESTTIDSLNSCDIGNDSSQSPCRNAPMNASSRSDQLSSLTRNISSLSSSSRNGNYPLTSSRRNDPLTSLITKDTLTSSIRDDFLTCAIGNAPLTSLVGNAPLTSIGNDPLTSSATNNDPVAFPMRNVRLTSSIRNTISTFSNENAESFTSTDRNDLLTCSIRNTTPSTRHAPLTALLGNAQPSARNVSLTSSARNDPLTSNDKSLDHEAETAASKGFAKEMKSCAVSDEQYCNMGNHSRELIDDVIEETTKSSCILQDFSDSAINSVKSVFIVSENRASSSFLQEMNGGIFANSMNNDASESLDLLARWENRMKMQEINAEINTNKVLSNTNLCLPPKNLKRKRKMQSMSRLVLGTSHEKGGETINHSSCH